MFSEFGIYESKFENTVPTEGKETSPSKENNKTVPTSQTQTKPTEETKKVCLLTVNLCLSVLYVLYKKIKKCRVYYK